MSDERIADRAAGAIMGAFIGDAMGLGPHGIMISQNCNVITASGSATIPIPGLAAIMTVSRRANFPRRELFSSLCWDRWLNLEGMMKRTFAAAWMRTCYHCLMAPQSTAQAAIPASRSANCGGGG